MGEASQRSYLDAGQSYVRSNLYGCDGAFDSCLKPNRYRPVPLVGVFILAETEPRLAKKGPSSGAEIFLANFIDCKRSPGPPSSSPGPVRRMGGYK